MASCDFDLSFTGSSDQFLAKAQAAAEKAGGKFEGDNIKGDFVFPIPFGDITGTYAVTGNTAHISIENKPIFISCDIIADVMKSKLK